ncbi:unnamed protein product [Cuscuta epithymum]|uniref:F-box domain-containing protein n=1 Tax=Cuscuta epithymum TaxID=186058 RepID=A0AAV0CW04_9ASTE|nr:unnamed protein product [Cuscuta epithymum]
MDDDFAKLPEECISEILSLTSPVDVSAFSIISKRFKSASDSDNAWSKFVPSDIDDIISKSSTPFPLESPPTKKQLFFSLSGFSFVLEEGKKVFYLDKHTGKKCVMISAAELEFSGANVSNQLLTTYDPHARFKEVAKLTLYKGVFDITLKMTSQLLLSKETHYSCYLMYKMEDARSYWDDARFK